MKEFYNLFLFIAICFFIFILFRSFHYNPMIIEGMTDASGNQITPPPNGVAGNAASYGATIKAANIRFQDQFLISKYRSDYETVILNLDDLVNNLMLQTALSVDQDKPQEAIKRLSDLNQARAALNSVMKYVDKQ